MGKQNKEWTTETLAEARKHLRETRDKIYRQTLWRAVTDLDTRTTHYLTAASPGPNVPLVGMSQVTRALQGRVVSPYDVPPDGRYRMRHHMPVRVMREPGDERQRVIEDRMFGRHTREAITGRPGGVIDLVRARRDFQVAIRLDLPDKNEVERLTTLARIEAMAAARIGSRMGGHVAERQATVQTLYNLGDTKWARVLGERLRKGNQTVYQQTETIRVLLRENIGRQAGEQLVERGLYRLGDIKGAVKGTRSLQRRYGK